MAMGSIPALLRERASLQPNRTAFTFMDYEQDRAGIAESLTWSQLYRRALNIAQELRLHGSTGDRAVILAPQGLDYITAFLGALQAGFIAVPLGGASDERVSSVMRDASPSAVLTTSSVVGDIAEYVESKSVNPSIVIEIDLLDLDSKKGPAARVDTSTDTTYLQYTSGSTRTPAGVMVSHQEHHGQFRAGQCRLLRGLRRRCPAGHHFGVLAAVLSRHGFESRNHLAGSDGISRCAHESGLVSAAAGPVDAIAGK